MTIKLSLILVLLSATATAQPVMETGGQKMPEEWIDKDTRHKVIRLTRNDGSNLSFYFHNSPFIGNKMVYYSSNRNDVSGIQKQETYSTNARNKQLHLLDLSTLKSEQLTYHSSPMNGEIVHSQSGNIYYHEDNGQFWLNLDYSARHPGGPYVSDKAFAIITP